MMTASAYEGELFERRIFADEGDQGRAFLAAEFFACTFRSCDFSECDLSASAFSRCVFEGCNLSLVGLNGTRLQDVTFKNCKLVGVDFSACSDFAFGANFEHSNLHLASFWSKRMPRSRFEGCELNETNFSECDLSRAVFEDSDLSGAVFDRTNLERADFRNARNFALDPAKNRVKKAKFSRADLAGLLYRYDLDIE